MRKSKIQLFEQIHRIHEMSNINPVSGKNLVVVDIQPEYMGGIDFLGEFVEFLNDNYDEISSITFLYNGYDTLGMVREDDYKFWWIEYGLDESIVYESRFYDKGYAFFRYCIDSDIDDDTTTNLVRMMIEKDINDSRQLDEEFWD